MDLAAQGGGNCELTKLNEIVTTANGVTIIGYADMPARGLIFHFEHSFNVLVFGHVATLASRFSKTTLGTRLFSRPCLNFPGMASQASTMQLAIALRM